LQGSDRRAELIFASAAFSGGLTGSRRNSLKAAQLLLFLALLLLTFPAQSQQAVLSAEAGSVLLSTAAEPGSIQGIVVDRSGAVYEGAKITLTQPPSAPRTTTSDSNGQFSFPAVSAGPFQLTVASSGFTSQTISGVLHSGESFDARSIVLAMKSTATEVDVNASQVEIAQEQLHIEETQRVLGVIPNFYVTYVPNAPPLSSRQKFSLAWRSSIDPVTFLASGAFAGIEQAANTFPGYGQGGQGYAKRFGANYADGFTANMLGGAILPAWWKQDPRYFYKGTGSVRSRALYAIAFAVVCKGDNGHWQPAYAGIVGGIAAGGISNLYYPASSRDGVTLTFENAALGTGLSAVQNLLQEFVIRRLTPHVPSYGTSKP